MKTIQLVRIRHSDHGMEGFLSCDGLLLHTLELPWRGNQPNISCIPPPQEIDKEHYQVLPRRSPKFGDTYHVTGVNGRTHILIHTGNYAGDKSKQLKTHVQGCILVGRKRGFLGKQRAVLSSRLAMNDLRRYIQKEPFILEIIQACPLEATHVS
ncbi:MAG: DUF5675 family protein [Cellvibrionaceae bacterium]